MSHNSVYGAISLEIGLAQKMMGIFRGKYLISKIDSFCVSFLLITFVREKKRSWRWKKKMSTIDKNAQSTDARFVTSPKEKWS